MEIKPWKKIKTKTIFEAFGRALEKQTYELPNQKISDYYVMRNPQIVSMLAITANQEVVLAKQFRPGPGAVLLELPGGGIDEDETPEQAAARELMEETGYAGTLTFVTRCLEDAYNTIDRHCFVATNCVKQKGYIQDNEEWTEAALMPLNQFRNHLRTGRLTDAEVAYLGLDFLGLL